MATVTSPAQTLPSVPLVHAALQVSPFDGTKMSWAHDSVANGGLGIVDLWNLMGVRGEGVGIAIIDTGITSTRSDFANIMATGFRNSDGLTDATDQDGHGTNCSGILAATGQNSVFGIAPDSDLYIYRFEIGSFGIPVDDLKTALSDIITANWPLDILSISYCFSQADDELFNLCNSIQNNRMIFSALNHQGVQGNPTDNNQYPANYDFVIPVGASNQDLQSLMPCSILENSNGKINWIFPGQGIRTIKVDGTPEPNGNQSSIATPFGAGVFALFLSYMKKRNIQINNANISLLKKLLLDYSFNPTGTNIYYCRPFDSFNNFSKYFN